MISRAPWTPWVEDAHNRILSVAYYRGVYSHIAPTYLKLILTNNIPQSMFVYSRKVGSPL